MSQPVPIEAFDLLFTVTVPVVGFWISMGMLLERIAKALESMAAGSVDVDMDLDENDDGDDE